MYMIGMMEVTKEMTGNPIMQGIDKRRPRKLQFLGHDVHQLQIGAATTMDGSGVAYNDTTVKFILPVVYAYSVPVAVGWIHTCCSYFYDRC
jgi:hypothetical protein